MKISNVHGLSSVFEIALKRSLAEYRNVGWRSVTGLIDSPRQKILLERHYDEITMDVADSLRMLEGTAMHDMLANLGAYEPDVITEKSVILMVEGMPVKMQADRIEPIDGRCGSATKYILKDFKRVKVGAWQMGGRKSWECQGNVYRLGYKALMDLEIVKVQFELILSNWNEVETVKHDYPPHPVMPLEINLWSYEEAMKYLTDRVKLFRQQEQLPDDQLIDCSDTERWMKPDYWCVWKKKGTLRPYRKYQDKEKAIEVQQGMGKPDEYEIRFEAGASVRCKTCEVKQWCKYCRHPNETGGDDE